MNRDVFAVIGFLALAGAIVLGAYLWVWLSAHLVEYWPL